MRVARRAGMRHAVNITTVSKQRDGDEGDRIDRRDLRDERLEDLADAEGGREAERQADAQLPQARAENQPRDLRRLRAEREPQAELLRALGDRVGRDRVDADRGEHQRDDRQR